MNAHALTVSDLNNDVFQDVAVVTGKDAEDKVLVLLGDGTGGFLPDPLAYDVVDPVDIVAGDFDGDNNFDDLATANDTLGAPEVSVLGNDNYALGTFFDPVGVATPMGPSAAITANFDVPASLVVAGHSEGVARLSNGTEVAEFLVFTAPPAPTFGGGVGVTAVAVDDLNDDAADDIVTANFVSQDVSVILSGETGGPTADTYPITTGPVSVTSGDFDDDGTPDLATAGFSSDQVTVMLTDTSGTDPVPGPPVQIPAGGHKPSTILSGDIAGDGNLDLVSVNASSNDASVLVGDGTGGFVLGPDPLFPETFPTGGGHPSTPSWPMSARTTGRSSRVSPTATSTSSPPTPAPATSRCSWLTASAASRSLGGSRPAPATASPPSRWLRSTATPSPTSWLATRKERSSSS